MGDNPMTFRLALGIAALLTLAGVAQGHAQGREPSPKANAARPGAPPVKLYKEVKRLNAACVAAGGGVSGSPDCDAANAKEDQLSGLGYCIDYPHEEKLARCDQLRSRPKR